MTLGRDESPLAAGAESNSLMENLKSQLTGERKGLRQMTGTKSTFLSPSMRRMEASLNNNDEGKIRQLVFKHCDILPDFIIFQTFTPIMKVN